MVIYLTELSILAIKDQQVCLIQLQLSSHKLEDKSEFLIRFISSSFLLVLLDYNE